MNTPLVANIKYRYLNLLRPRHLKKLDYAIKLIKMRRKNVKFIIRKSYHRYSHNLSGSLFFELRFRSGGIEMSLGNVSLFFERERKERL